MTLRKIYKLFRECDHATATVITFRAAARVWPMTVEYDKNHGLTFVSARALLTAQAVTQVGRDDELAEDVDGAVCEAAVDAELDPHTPVSCALRACSTASYIAVAMEAMEYDDWAACTVWSTRDLIGDPEVALARTDFGFIKQNSAEDLWSQPLWLNDAVPHTSAWRETSDILGANPAFGFWLRWYEGVLERSYCQIWCPSVPHAAA